MKSQEVFLVPRSGWHPALRSDYHRDPTIFCIRFGVYGVMTGKIEGFEWVYLPVVEHDSMTGSPELLTRTWGVPEFSMRHVGG